MSIVTSCAGVRFSFRLFMSFYIVGWVIPGILIRIFLQRCMMALLGGLDCLLPLKKFEETESFGAEILIHCSHIYKEVVNNGDDLFLDDLCDRPVAIPDEVDEGLVNFQGAFG